MHRLVTVRALIRRLSSFGDWSIAAKLAAAPMIALLALVLQWWQADTTIRWLSVGAIPELVSGVDEATQLSTMVADLRAVNAALYTVLTTRAAASEGGGTPDLNAVQAMLDKLIADVASFRANVASPEAQSRLDRISEQLNSFKGAVVWVSTMLDVDFQSAVSFLQPFQATYEETARELNSLMVEEVAKARAEAQRADNEAAGKRRSFLVAALLTGLAVIGLSILIALRVRGAILSIADATLRLARSELDIPLRDLARGDELGTIVDSLHVFRDNAIRVRQLNDQQAQERQRAEAERHALLSSLADDFEKQVMGSLRAVTAAVDGMRQEGRQMAELTRHAQARSTQVQDAADATAGNVQAVSAAAEEMSACIGEIGQQADRSATMVNHVAADATRANADIEALEQAATRIGEIVGLIASVAQRTNLLALNATIEAARAGDAGRGFAVVASEVKTLAIQTTQATEDVANQVSGIRRAVGEAVRGLKSITEQINTVSASVAGIASAIEQQNIVTRDISHNMLRASQGTQAMSSGLHEVGDAMSRTNIGVGRVAGATDTVASNTGLLTRHVEGFLSRIRHDGAAA